MWEQSAFIPRYTLYYEVLHPADTINSLPPIVMIPGGAHTGACYKVTPDGRSGWAQYFANRGFTVYVIDWPGVGRSGVVDHQQLTGQFVVEGIGEVLKKINKKVILITHSMSGAYGWKILELFPQYLKTIIALAPAPMGNIQTKPKVIFTKKNSLKVRGGSLSYTIDLSQDYVVTDDFIQKKLIGKSSVFPENFLDNYRASLVPIPPTLLCERLNIDGKQLKVNFSLQSHSVDVLVVTGSADSDHPKEVDERVVQFLRQHHIHTTYYWLGDKGFVGNGHMLMLEKNSDQIAELLRQFIFHSVSGSASLSLLAKDENRTGNKTQNRIIIQK